MNKNQKVGLTLLFPVGTEIEGIMKTEMNITQEWNVGEAVSVGADTASAIPIPQDPPDRYWGVWTALLVKERTHPVTLWKIDGTSEHAGTVSIRAQLPTCQKNPSSFKTFLEAANNPPDFGLEIVDD